jgi:hypothetical protein
VILILGVPTAMGTSAQMEIANRVTPLWSFSLASALSLWGRVHFISVLFELFEDILAMLLCYGSPQSSILEWFQSSRIRSGSGTCIPGVPGLSSVIALTTSSLVDNLGSPGQERSERTLSRTFKSTYCTNSHETRLLTFRTTVSQPAAFCWTTIQWF